MLTKCLNVQLNLPMKILTLLSFYLGYTLSKASKMIFDSRLQHKVVHKLLI